MREPAIPAQEIADLLAKAIAGEVPIKVLRCGWNEAYAGDVFFDIGGYSLTIFNDCMELDYVSEVIAPDGRKCGFDAWYDAGGDPVSLLSEHQIADLENLFEGLEPQK